MAAVEVTPVGTISLGAGTGGASAAVEIPTGAETGVMSTTGASVGTGSAGVSAGGAGFLDATESEQHHEQTQADKDLLGLITETRSPEVR